MSSRKRKLRQHAVHLTEAFEASGANWDNVDSWVDRQRPVQVSLAGPVLLGRTSAMSGTKAQGGGALLMAARHGAAGTVAPPSSPRACEEEVETVKGRYIGDYIGKYYTVTKGL